MKGSYYYKYSSNLKLSMKNYFYNNKTFIFLMIFVIVLSLITGIFTGIKCSSDISISNCNDKVLVGLFEDDISIVSFFVKRVFSYFCVLLVMFLICRFKISIPLLIIFMAYTAFSLGLNIVVIILVFGFGGALNVVLVILPVHFCVLIIYSICTIFAIKDCLTICTYGRCIGDKNPILKWVLLYILLFILAIIETVFINLTHASFIFII